MAKSIISGGHVKLVRRCGRVLFAVFLLTVATALFPLRLQSLEWALRFSQSIVNSASLALVGVGLLRYAAFLESQASADPTSDPQTPYATEGNQGATGSRKSKARSKRRKAELWIKRLALAGAIGLLFLSAWQFVLFLRGLDSIDKQALSAGSRADKQVRDIVRDIESAILKAPDLRIDAEWQRVQSSLASPSSTTALDAGGKRKQLFLFALTIFMCCFAGLVATRKLREADPVDIF